jgi:hypothetical protein
MNRLERIRADLRKINAAAKAKAYREARKDDDAPVDTDEVIEFRKLARTDLPAAKQALIERLSEMRDRHNAWKENHP